jgi:hypothetical protein
MENWLKHVKENEETFKLWIEMNETVQPSNDLLAPIIPVFNKEFPTMNINSCQECVIDMLRWARIELRKAEMGDIKPQKNGKSSTN